MTKQEDFYTKRSEAVGALVNLIKLLQDSDRDMEEELNEVLFEAQDDCGIKTKDKMQLM